MLQQAHPTTAAGLQHSRRLRQLRAMARRLWLDHHSIEGDLDMFCAAGSVMRTHRCSRRWHRVGYDGVIHTTITSHELGNNVSEAFVGITDATTQWVSEPLIYLVLVVMAV